MPQVIQPILPPSQGLTSHKLGVSDGPRPGTAPATTRSAPGRRAHPLRWSARSSGRHSRLSPGVTAPRQRGVRTSAPAQPGNHHRRHIR